MYWFEFLLFPASDDSATRHGPCGLLGQGTDGQFLEPLQHFWEAFQTCVLLPSCFTMPLACGPHCACSTILPMSLEGRKQR
jgi:hypothetical protein